MDWQKLERETWRLKSERLEYEDVFAPDLLAGNPGLEVQNVGGGYLVRPRRAGAIEEIHVILHGSVRLPLEARWAVAPCDPEEAASTLVDNCDLGTAALGMELAHWIAADYSANRSLAFFDVARVLIDGNRYKVEDQVPERPYRGAPILRASLTAAQRQALVEQWLSPWIEFVSTTIIRDGVLRALHHHSYDPVGQISSSLDSSPRPAGMVFYKSPVETQRKLVDSNLLEKIRAILERCVRQIQPDAEVRVDSPYACPLMPLLPELLVRQSSAGPAPQMSTIIYEVRKDLLRQRKHLQMLVEAVKAISDEAGVVLPLVLPPQLPPR